MATGVTEKGDVEDYDECPVCRECLKDPHLLNCEHYFCRGCLEGVARENPQGHIKCPTCREVTKVAQGSGVKDLPKHEGKYSLLEQVTGFLARAKHQEVAHYCDCCGDKKVTAKSHCYQCVKKLCRECLDKHQQITTSHITAPMVDSIFCASHTRQVVSFHCRDCQKNICIDCAFNEHVNHRRVGVNEVANESQARLLAFLKTQTAMDNDELTLKRIQSKLEKARELDYEFKESVTTTRKLINDLVEKLDQVECDTKAKLAAEIKTLVLYESDIKDIIASKKRLIHHATYLTEKASDPELVEQEKDFPMTLNSLQNVGNSSVELPILDNTFKDICAQLQQMITDCKVKFGKDKIGDFKKQCTVCLPDGQAIGCIAMDINDHRVVARTGDTGGPLKVYDYTGKLQVSLGAGVTGLADSCRRGLCIDSKRDLYLATCSKSLVLVHKAGLRTKIITVGGKHNRGVAYHEEVDCYLVCNTDPGKETVYLIGPNTWQVYRHIGLPGSSTSQFSFPGNIHVGAVGGIDSSCILVSDSDSNHIRVFDISGKLHRTYGSQGSGKGQLKRPESVTTDNVGRVIVSDRNNNRVVSFWTNDAGREEWDCLISNDWDGKQPRFLALDTTVMVMVIVDESYQKLYIYN